MDNYIKKNLSSNLKAIGTFEDMNKFQYEKLIEFKEEILKKAILNDFSEYNSTFLVKFLRARKFDLSLAIPMSIECVKWRKEQNFYGIINKTYEKERSLKQVYPRCYHKTDKKGRPIYIEILSETKFDKIFELVTDDELYELVMKDYERYTNYILPMCSKAIGKSIEQCLCIFCVKNIGVGFVNKVSIFIFG